MKKILFLGASHAQIPPIMYAKEMGYVVYTTDNKPENPGHELADKSFEVSTTDRELVLDLARKLNIDAIIAYASDPAAPTAAYVSEKLGLIGNPLESVETLTNKGRFRSFLQANGFMTPKSKEFDTVGRATKFVEELEFPLFVKPIDSSGSKGVTKVDHADAFAAAFTKAKNFSLTKKVVVEEVIPRSFRQVDSDIFMQDGELKFWIWGDQRQDAYCHEFAPIGISFPSQLDFSLQLKAKREVERLLKTLNFETGAFNVEFLIDAFENIWIIEIGPRNGGNLIPEVISICTDQNMIAWTVEAALGRPIEVKNEMSACRYVSSYLVHARETGRYNGLFIDECLRDKIIKLEIFVEYGSQVRKYEGSNTTLGMIIFEFASASEMASLMDDIESFVKVLVDHSDV